MTLRRSIMLSLALHMLLLGAGLAFARYGMVRSALHEQTVMVTLIGRGEDASGSGHAGAKSAPLARVVQKSGPTMPTVERPANAPAAPAPAVVPLTLSSNGEDAGQATSGASSEDLAAGNDTGAASSEQWAVIVSSIERVKNYPRLARERGIEGVVRLRFRMKPQGEVDKIEIVKSSGSDILDSASVRTVRRAGPLPYVKGWVEVPIAYVLK